MYINETVREVCLFIFLRNKRDTGDVEGKEREVCIETLKQV
jgi:hypothetical protein